MLELELEINENMVRIWIPANVGVVDESMAPTKIRNNPHHVYIMRKPHPNGIKNWSLVDYSGYFVSFSMFRRTDVDGKECPPEPTHETVTRLSKHLPEKSIVVGDSYFRSVQAVEALAKQGKHSLFSCTQKRPAVLFHDDIVQELVKDGDSCTTFGSVEGKDGEAVPIMANAFMSEKRVICTLSTVYSDNMEDAEVEIMGGGEDVDLATYKTVVEKRPEARVKYQKMMDCVDKADAQINQVLPGHRTKKWSTVEKVWEIMMLLSVNAKKVYESATGEEVEPKNWRKMLKRTLLHLPAKRTDEHPKSSPKKCSPKSRCRSCSALCQKNTKTTWRCPVCGPICKKCQKKGPNHLKSLHERYYELPCASRAVRRSYGGRRRV